MGARLFAVAALAALLVAQCSATISLTDDEINGLKGQCWGPDNHVPGRQTPCSNCLQQQACQDCVEDAYDTSITQGQAKMYGCWAMCQNQTAMDLDAGAATQCYDCLASPLIKDPYACQTCIIDMPTFALRTECIECAEKDPYQGQRKEYFYACAQCSLITLPDAKDYCTRCVQIILLDDKGELGPEWTNTDPDQVPYPAYEFGKCVAAAQSLQALLTGQEDPSGIQSLCFDTYKAFEQKYPVYTEDERPPISECIQCVIESTLLSPIPAVTSNKAYGCSQYCLDPSLVHNDDQLDQCRQCITSKTITDPWACSNCMAAINSIDLTDDETFEQRTSCMGCVENNPFMFRDGYSNFNWACGQCASLGDSEIRQECYRCISNETGFIKNPDDICQCIDITVNNGFSSDVGLDAMQRSCFSNWTVDVLLDNNSIDLQLVYMYLNDSALNGAEFAQYRADLVEALGIEWRPLHVLGGIMPTNGATCLDCMADMVIYNSELDTPGPDRRFACRQYCQDPTLILDEDQATQCTEALKCKIVDPDTGVESYLDPWGVQNCLVISTTIGTYPSTTAIVVGATQSTSEVDTIARALCLGCICENPGKYDSFPWACGQCSTLSTQAARDACFTCLQAGLLDPCQCVDDAKNSPPVPLGCPAGQSTCPGDTVCGYKLVVQVETLTTCQAWNDLDNCMAQAAIGTGSFVKGCNDATFDPLTCKTSTTLLYSSAPAVPAAQTLFHANAAFSGTPANAYNTWTASNGAWPDSDFVTCVGLPPCEVTMYVFPDGNFPAADTFSCNGDGDTALCGPAGCAGNPGPPPCTTPTDCRDGLLYSGTPGCSPCQCPTGLSVPSGAVPTLISQCKCPSDTQPYAPYVCSGGLVYSDTTDKCKPCACPDDKDVNSRFPDPPMTIADCTCTKAACPTGLIPASSNPCDENCVCPPTARYTGAPGTFPTSSDQCVCPSGTYSCSGSTFCGYKLVLTASQDQNGPLNVPNLGTCWGEAAKNMKGYLETCAPPSTTTTTATVTMIFNSTANLEAALALFSGSYQYSLGGTETIRSWPAWPNSAFVNCAQLPCTTTISLYKDPLGTYTPPSTVPIHTYFSCGGATSSFVSGAFTGPSYLDLPTGDVAYVRPPLCYGPKAAKNPIVPPDNKAGTICECTSCPEVGIWKWIGTPDANGVPSRTVGSYFTNPPTYTGMTGPSYFLGDPSDSTSDCQEYHGNCCIRFKQSLLDAAAAAQTRIAAATAAKTAPLPADIEALRAVQPRCPTSSCPGNRLWKNSARANHVGSCNSPSYQFNPQGRCTNTNGAGRRSLQEELSFSWIEETESTGRQLLATNYANTVYTSRAGPGFVVDPKKPKLTWYAYCDYEAYGGNGNLCMSYQSGIQVNHCFGRVACRDGLT